MNNRFKFTAPVEIQASAGDGDEKKLPTFSMVAYTGGAMTPGGFYSPVVVDLSGVDASADVAILLDHDPSQIVGQGKAKVSGNQITVEGTVMAEDDNAEKVVTLAKNGFKWQASIGADITRREYLDAGKKLKVNGQDVTGPAIIARETRLYEVSFVALGADSKTSAAVAASHAHGKGELAMEFVKWLQASGFDPDAVTEAQKDKLKALYDVEHGGTHIEVKTPAVQAAQKPGEYTELSAIAAKARADKTRCDAITKIAATYIDEIPWMTDEIEAAAKKAIGDRIEPDQFELQMIRATRPVYQGGVKTRSADQQQLSDKVIEAAICQAAGLKDYEKKFDERTLEAANKKWGGALSLQELLLTAAKANGHDGISLRSAAGITSVLRACFRDPIRASSGFSTIDVTSILSNVANKFITESFLSVESAWRAITAIRPVSDFKTITNHALTGDLQYEKLGPGGEIKHGTLGEETYTNKADTYAKMLAITRTDIINDDLGAFAAVPRRLGRGAALKINDVFWTEFLDNSTFFTSGRGNYDDGASDTLMDITGLTNADTLFRLLTDPDGKPLGSVPQILLVPTALRVKALTLMNSMEVRTSEALTSGGAQYGTENPFAGAFQVVSSTYLQNSAYTGYSAKAWYLLGDPNDLPVIETCFLGGREQPVVETADADFDQLGVKMRAYHDFGVSKQEYRGGVKMKGEN